MDLGTEEEEVLVEQALGYGKFKILHFNHSMKGDNAFLPPCLLAGYGIPRKVDMEEEKGSSFLNTEKPLVRLEGWQE